MKQATLIEIAESCKVTKPTVWRWAKKAGTKISSIERKLKNAVPRKPALFNADEIVCIISEGNESFGMLAGNSLSSNLTNDSLQNETNDSLQNETNNLLQKKQSLTIDQKIKIAELVVEVAKLSEQTRPGMQLDYHLNIAKKRLSGLAANNKYTPALNLLEAPNNEEE